MAQDKEKGISELKPGNLVRFNGSEYGILLHKIGAPVFDGDHVWVLVSNRDGKEKRALEKSMTKIA